MAGSSVGWLATAASVGDASDEEDGAETPTDSPISLRNDSASLAREVQDRGNAWQRAVKIEIAPSSRDFDVRRVYPA